MNLDSAQLAAFAAVLEEGSFDAAARRLYVTPSAVSQRIKALESHLGQVVVRRSRPVRATAAGQVLARLASQVSLLEGEAIAELAADPSFVTALPLPVAINSDSLATWFLPAVAALPADVVVRFDLHAEDQDHTAALLRDGTVMAAVTADSRAAQGCRAEPLGSMRYAAVASPAFCERYLPGGPSAEAMGRAPVLVFNRKDALQERFARVLTGHVLDPPVNFLPSSTAFVDAARLGLGWGMVPEQMAVGPLKSGELVELSPGRYLDVPLYWQRWRLESRVLATLTQAVRSAASDALTPIG